MKIKKNEADNMRPHLYNLNFSDICPAYIHGQIVDINKEGKSCSKQQYSGLFHLSTGAKVNPGMLENDTPSFMIYHNRTMDL